MGKIGKIRSFRFRGLAFRYGFYILTSIWIVFIIAFTYTFTFTYKILLSDAEENASNVTYLAIAKIRNTLQPIEEVPKLIAKRIEMPDAELKPVLRTMKEFIYQNKEVYGSCIAFEPYQYDKKKRSFAPYFFEKNDSISEKFLDSKDYDYFRQSWYNIPKLTGKSVWSEPYFDKGGGEMFMCTYSVPFYRKTNGSRIFAGVVTMDVSLATLRKNIDSIHIYKSGFGFLISRSGRIITYPDSSWINKDIRDVTKNIKDINVLRSLEKMMKGESGFVRLQSIREEKPSWMYYSPVTATEWSFGLIFPSGDLFASFFSFSYRLIIIFILSVIALLVLIVLITRKFTRPLTQLALATRNIGKGNFMVSLPIYKAKDEIMELSNSFSLMQEELQLYIDHLRETTSAKEKMESEITVARTIQMGMLPKSFPVRDDCNISAILEPAKGIGGDLYDFLFKDEDHLFIAIGDVSGKGIPASLFMAVTRTLFRSGIEKGEPLNLMVTAINHELCHENPNQMFVTFIVGLIDLKTGVMDLCNAGHNPPMIIRKDGSVEKVTQRNGLPLGIFEKTSYTSEKLILGAGDIFLLYTDGITESLNSQNQLFGERKLVKCLEDANHLTSKEIISKVLDEVKMFSGEAEPNDDITMLVIKYLNSSKLSGKVSGSGYLPAEYASLNITNQINEITKIAGWLKELSVEWELSSQNVNNINLALEELISNIIFYAYEDDEKHVIEIVLTRKDGILSIQTADDGKAFNILEKERTPETTLSVKDRFIGGLGIHLIKTLMDKVEYKRESGKNIVILIKKLNS